MQASNVNMNCLLFISPNTVIFWNERDYVSYVEFDVPQRKKKRISFDVTWLDVSENDFYSSLAIFIIR